MDGYASSDKGASIDVEEEKTAVSSPSKSPNHHNNYGGTSNGNGAFRNGKSDPVYHEEELSLKDLLELKRYDAKEILHFIDARFGSMQELCNKLGTDQDEGLNDEFYQDISRRREKFGSNAIPPKPTTSFFVFLWEAAQDTTLIILTVAAILSFGLSFYRPPANSNIKNGNEFVTTGSTTQDLFDPEETEAERYERRAGWIEAVGILLAVVIIILVTALVNWSKDIQFRGLQDRLSCQHHACVIRSGKRKMVAVEELVVGDICVLNYGDVIPADGLLLFSVDLRLDESSHTGESEEVNKSVNSDPILFSGTHVKEGSGRMVVTAVGVHSAKGLILGLMGVSFNDEKEPEEKRSLLHGKLTRIALTITYAGTVIAILTFLILVIRFCVETFGVKGLPWDHTYFHQFVRFLIISITLLAVAVPEGLPLAVILALAYSVKKMMTDNNLVRHLDACETMGSATTICCDKTGTLTANKMRVVQSFIMDSEFSKSDSFDGIPLELRSEISVALATNTNYTSQVGIQSGSMTCGGTAIGSKTECALLELIDSLGQDYKDIRRVYPETHHIHTYPFNSERKWMGTVVRYRSPSASRKPVGGQASELPYRLMVKGAAEIILEKCDWIVGEKCSIQSLSEGRRRRNVDDVINAMTNQGLRTLCIAYKDFIPSGSPLPHESRLSADLNWREEETVCRGLTCLAIVGIEDPVRPEVEEAVQQCQNAGIVVRMITGDNIQTARFIAYKCGIIAPEDHDRYLVLDGPTFNKMVRLSPDGPVDQGLMDEVWPRLRVLARSTPHDKFTLVKGIMDSRLDGEREVVAVTGDGTNDGPALKKAHVGFAMGISGTDVAKEASDIILIDDNFASIIKAVIWGRHVYDSIAKFLQFQLTVNIVAVVMSLIGACVVADSPLKGAQMLWVNLLMDTLASLSLATERPSEEVLNRKPYRCSSPLVSPRMLLNILGHSFYELVVLLSLLFGGASMLGVEDGRTEALRSLPSQHYTVIFNSFVMMILFNEICARKLDNSLNFFSGLHRAPVFVIIWLTSFCSQIAIIEWGGAIFSTTSLTPAQWGLCILFGVGDLVYGFILSLTVRCAISWQKNRNRRSTCCDLEKLSFNKSSAPYELLTMEPPTSK